MIRTSYTKYYNTIFKVYNTDKTYSVPMMKSPSSIDYRFLWAISRNINSFYAGENKMEKFYLYFHVLHCVPFIITYIQTNPYLRLRACGTPERAPK